ncbi:hypothetical protein PF005_g8867 [Phytophthora fragariae]|uniref:Uncharacterized protein n=1 Tax=Phytophthora fragariae TaxID=53985 RepID=A0A6A3YDL4_9STRA|nr:hypothetical protein PF009_g10187 [Phytophthora fragariae]KAE9014414.1 hypothetical protein PF011_g8060 [Phytophthora fragariae]KAE9119222.1 hypothetical protein PF007_g8627 [Phytophthora fragariae]KAE9216893.1 hypothetical protein PF005_g8867 [Phytophthora fragariae]
MEALRLQDGAYVSARYDQLQELRRQREQLQPDQVADEAAPSGAFSRELSDEERQELEQWRIVERATALDAQGPTPQWSKKFSVLSSVLGSLYAGLEADPPVTSPSKKALSRPETGDGTSPVSVKELPLATQVALKMFFRTCQSLRDPMKLTANSRLSVRIASKLPVILTTMPPCVLSPGLVDDTLEDEGDVSSVFYQLFRLFEQLLGVGDEVGEESSTASGSGEGVCLSGSDRATVIVAYVALALKWGRLAYLLKGVKLLLESGGELDGARFEPLGPLFREIATTSIERPQIAFGEEEQPRGYLMSFGKGDHATRDVLFRKIDSLSTHSIAITAKGEAMAWGNGDKYRLGHGSSSKEYMPRTIEFLSLKGRVRDLACGLGHTLALMESGELYAWGNGSNGRLGLGDTNDRSSPTRVVTPPLSSEESSESNKRTHGERTIKVSAGTGTRMTSGPFTR